MSTLKIFTGKGRNPNDVLDPIAELPPPPPWRDFTNPNRSQEQANKLIFADADIELVNVAIYLRRPLLVTGRPGLGKSSLAQLIANELKLTLYKWPINTRTSLQDGLYRYDALARLRDAQIQGYTSDEQAHIGQYITLGPLGQALLPSDRPSVLLIDEIDKGDIDLPNDLLHIFEEGEFYIPEITRTLLNSDRTTSEFTAVHRPDGTTVSIPDGRVRCTSFPIIVMTSNGEREFPPAFLRRCIRLDIQPIRDLDRLAQIVRTHLGDDLFQKAELLIRKYIADYAAQQKSSAKQEYIAIDQLLNFLFVVLQIDEADEKGREQLRTSLLRDLGN